MPTNNRDITFFLRAKNKTQQVFRTVNGQLDGIKEKFSAIGSRLGLAFGVLGGGGVLAGVKKMADELDEIANVADKLGTTTEELSKLRHAAELTGVSAGTLDTALQRMTRRVAEAAQGTGEAKKALEELGLDAQKLAEQTPDQAFREIADAMTDIPGQADKVRLAFKLFDTEGVDLVRTLEGGSRAINQAGDDLERLGGVISDEAAREAQKFNADLIRMQANLDAMGQKIGSKVLPRLNDMFELLSGRDPSRLGTDALVGDQLERINSQIVNIREELKRLEDGPTVTDGLFGNTQVFEEDLEKARRQALETLQRLEEERARIIEQSAVNSAREREQSKEREHNRKIAAERSAGTEQLKRELKARAKALEEYIRETEAKSEELRDAGQKIDDFIQELDDDIKKSLVEDAGLGNSKLDNRISEAQRYLAVLDLLAAAQRKLDREDYQGALKLVQNAFGSLQKLKEDGTVANQSLLDVARSLKKIQDEAENKIQLKANLAKGDLALVKNELNTIDGKASVAVDMDAESLAAARQRIQQELGSKPVKVSLEQPKEDVGITVKAEIDPQQIKELRDQITRELSGIVVKIGVKAAAQPGFGTPGGGIVPGLADGAEVTLERESDKGGFRL